MQVRDAITGCSRAPDTGLLDPLTDMPFGVYGHLCDVYDVDWFFRGDRNA
jgi:hypothetical protein